MITSTRALATGALEGGSEGEEVLRGWRNDGELYRGRGEVGEDEMGRGKDGTWVVERRMCVLKGGCGAREFCFRAY